MLTKIATLPLPPRGRRMNLPKIGRIVRWYSEYSPSTVAICDGMKTGTLAFSKEGREWVRIWLEKANTTIFTCNSSYSKCRFRMRIPITDRGKWAMIRNSALTKRAEHYQIEIINDAPTTPAIFLCVLCSQCCRTEMRFYINHLRYRENKSADDELDDHFDGNHTAYEYDSASRYLRAQHHNLAMFQWK